jgi:hypothetical protein
MLIRADASAWGFQEGKEPESGNIPGSIANPLLQRLAGIQTAKITDSKRLRLSCTGVVKRSLCVKGYAAF